MTVPAVDLTDMSDHLLGFRESCQPIWETALGIKVNLEAEGWSTDAAEAMALQWVDIMMSTVKAQIVGGVYEEEEDEDDVTDDD